MLFSTLRRKLVAYPTKSEFNLLQNLNYHFYVIFPPKKTSHTSCFGCPYFSTLSYNKTREIQTVLQEKAFSQCKFQSANKLIQYGPKGDIPEGLYYVTRSPVEFKLRDFLIICKKQQEIQLSLDQAKGSEILCTGIRSPVSFVQKRYRFMGLEKQQIQWLRTGREVRTVRTTGKWFQEVQKSRCFRWT